MAKDYWISDAIEHKGTLTKWAKAHGFIEANGNINLNEAETFARKHNLNHRISQIELARRLKSFKKK